MGQEKGQIGQRLEAKPKAKSTYNVRCSGLIVGRRESTPRRDISMELSRRVVDPARSTIKPPTTERCKGF